MITMFSNSLIEQFNVNRRTCHIAMKAVSADSCYSVGWLGARAASACAEVSTGSVEARLGFRSFRSSNYIGNDMYRSGAKYYRTIVQYFLLVFTIFEVLEGPIHGGNELELSNCK
jgi:hypothetical protein